MSLKELSEQYNQFQHDFGQDTPHDHENRINTLFTSTFKKIANGKELVGQRSELLPQLKGVKEFAETWVIEPQEIIPSSDQTTCTIRYFLKSEKAGHFPDDLHNTLLSQIRKGGPL